VNTRKLLLGCVGAVLLIGIAGMLVAFLWWQSYKTGPAYSLALLVDAVQRDDRATFDELVDTDSVVKNFVPQVTEKAIGRYASGITAPLREQIEALVPTLLPSVKQRVRDEVTKQIKQLAARAEGKPFILIALGMPYEVDIKEEGDTAHVAVNLNNRPTELTMQRQGDRWKIVAVKDDTLATQIVNNIAKDLPSIQNELEKQVREQLKKGGLPDLLKNNPLLDNKKGDK
jgi:BMFP domain-containing protein YqiC